MTIVRVLSNQGSGRAFLETFSDQFGITVDPQAWSEAMRSPRRLALHQELCRLLRGPVSAGAGAWDVFADEPSLAGFDIWAGDGTYFEHACHDPAIDGTKYATPQFFVLNLRSHQLAHLTVGDQSQGRKKEHDMRALKRLTPQVLRQGAPAGRKVIMVWDRAGIDIAQWVKWKQAHGLYFVSRAKDNMNLTKQGNYSIADIPVNEGVEDDAVVYISSQAVRCVTYRCPLTNKVFRFLTVLPQSVPPGVVAALYLARWDVEKCFDECKNKLEEGKSWATSPIAKTMQAESICLAHNLLLLLERKMAVEDGIHNPLEDKRRHKRLDQAITAVTKTRRKQNDGQREQRTAKLEPKHRQRCAPIPELLLRIKARATVRTIRFIRWVRTNLSVNKPWEALLEQLRRRYVTGRT